MEPNASLTDAITIALVPGELGGKIEAAMRKEIGRIRTRAGESTSTLRANVNALVAEAKHNGMRAESLIIVMKKTWQAIPDTRSFARPVAIDSLLTEMIAMALDAFYEPSSSASQRVD